MNAWVGTAPCSCVERLPAPASWAVNRPGRSTLGHLPTRRWLRSPLERAPRLFLCRSAACIMAEIIVPSRIMLCDENVYEHYLLQKHRQVLPERYWLKPILKIIRIQLAAWEHVPTLVIAIAAHKASTMK